MQHGNFLQKETPGWKKRLNKYIPSQSKYAKSALKTIYTAPIIVVPPPVLILFCSHLFVFYGSWFLFASVSLFQLIMLHQRFCWYYCTFVPLLGLRLRLWLALSCISSWWVINNKRGGGGVNESAIVPDYWCLSMFFPNLMSNKFSSGSRNSECSLSSAFVWLKIFWLGIW